MFSFFRRKKKPAPVTRANVRRAEYYRRGNSFYRYDDDSLIEDLILIGILTDMFDSDLDLQETVEMNESGFVEAPAAASAPSVDEIVERSTPDYPSQSYTPEPSYSAPEPDRYSSGGYDSGGSSYDSGGSDSGGSFD